VCVITDKREGSGDSEGIGAETDGRSQGGNWTYMLHLSRGLSQSANKGVCCWRYFSKVEAYCFRMTLNGILSYKETTLVFLESGNSCAVTADI